MKFKPPSFGQQSTSSTRISFPKGSMFMKGSQPKFLGGSVAAAPLRVNTGVGNNLVNKKNSFFGGFFGGLKNKNKNFIKANKFNKAKPGYAFKTGDNGLGYYKNEGPVVAQGPLNKPNGFGEPVFPNKPNVPNKPNGPNGPNKPNGPNGPNKPNGPNGPNKPNGPNGPNKPNGPTQCA